MIRTCICDVIDEKNNFFFTIPTKSTGIVYEIKVFNKDICEYNKHWAIRVQS